MADFVCLKPKKLLEFIIHAAKGTAIDYGEFSDGG